MTYRTAADATRPVVTRRVPSGDAFRWLKIILGGALVAFAVFLAWVGVWSSVRCTGDRCAVVQSNMLRPDQEFPFDARSAPPIVLEPATVGKNGKGLKLLLQYPSGDVEIVRDWPRAAEAEAARMRAYLADPRGELVVEKPRGALPYMLVWFPGVLGALMFLEGAKLMRWHRLRADPNARTIALETVAFGLSVRKRTFPVGSDTKLGSAPLRPDDPRVRLRVLTLEDPGAEPRRLPMYERDETRRLVEAMIAEAG